MYIYNSRFYLNFAIFPGSTCSAAAPSLNPAQSSCVGALSSSWRRPSGPCTTHYCVHICAVYAIIDCQVWDTETCIIWKEFCTWSPQACYAKRFCRPGRWSYWHGTFQVGNIFNADILNKFRQKHADNYKASVWYFLWQKVFDHLNPHLCLILEPNTIAAPKIYYHYK